MPFFECLDRKHVLKRFFDFLLVENRFDLEHRVDRLNGQHVRLCCRETPWCRSGIEGDHVGLAGTTASGIDNLTDTKANFRWKNILQKRSNYLFVGLSLQPAVL